MKFFIFLTLVAANASAFAASGILSYDDLVGRTMAACENPTSLMNESFTNDIASFKAQCTNEQERTAADVALALFLMDRFDRNYDEKAFDLHLTVASNILYSTLISDTSWVRYAGGFEYICGLNARDEHERSFTVTTNLLQKLSVSPPDMTASNLWPAVMLMEGCRGATPSSALKLNAAFEMARKERIGEIASYTNSLPPAMIEFFLREK